MSGRRVTTASKDAMASAYRPRLFSTMPRFVVGLQQQRVKVDRRRIINQRPLGVAQIIPGVAPLVVRRRGQTVDFQRGAQRGHRFVGPPASQAGHAQVEPHREVVRDVARPTPWNTVYATSYLPMAKQPFPKIRLLGLRPCCSPSSSSANRSSSPATSPASSPVRRPPRGRGVRAADPSPCHSSRPANRPNNRSAAALLIAPTSSPTRYRSPVERRADSYRVETRSPPISGCRAICASARAE